MQAFQARRQVGRGFLDEGHKQLRHQRPTEGLSSSAIRQLKMYPRLVDVEVDSAAAGALATLQLNADLASGPGRPRAARCYSKEFQSLGC